MNVVFDSMGTLFDLASVKERLGDTATEAWFDPILHSAAALTIVGERPRRGGLQRGLKPKA